MSAISVAALTAGLLLMLPPAPASADGFGEITAEVVDFAGFGAPVTERKSSDGADAFSEEARADGQRFANAPQTLARARESYTETFAGRGLTDLVLDAGTLTNVDPGMRANAAASYGLTFTVFERAKFVASGEITALQQGLEGNAAGGSFFLSSDQGEGPPEVEQSGPGSAPIDFSGTLEPGTYRLDVDIQSGASSAGEEPAFSTATVNLRLSLSDAPLTCFGKPPTKVGTAASETIVGRPNKEDVIIGGGGVDTIRGLGKNDILCGDGGDADTGPGDDDRLFGGPGIDALEGQGGFDTLDGGNTNETDLLFAGFTDDPGRLEFTDAFGANRLDGGRGNDFVTGGPANDVLLGGAGKDVVQGGDAGDLIKGQGGADDPLAGDGGEDRVLGGARADTIEGDAEDGPGFFDRLLGGPGRDRILGRGGDDSIKGGDESGAGDKRLDGGSGEDDIFGERGNDKLFGGPDPDLLDGGDDRDFCESGGDEGDVFFRCEEEDDQPPGG